MKMKWPWVSRKKHEAEVAALKVRVAGLQILNNRLMAASARDSAARGALKQEIDKLCRLRKQTKKGGE